MRINDVVITAISNLFRVYICWKFIRFFFDERKVEARTEKAVYFIFYIGTLLFFVCLQSHGINLIVNLAGIFLLTLIYKGSLKKKALAAVLIYIMNCGCDTLAYFLFLNSNQDIPETQNFSIVTDLLGSGNDSCPEYIDDCGNWHPWAFKTGHYAVYRRWHADYKYGCIVSI